MDYVNAIFLERYNSDPATMAFEILEQERLKDLQKYMQTMPVYPWLLSVKGLGTKGMAKLIAIIDDIKRFPNPSSLWSYAGVGDSSKEKKQKGVQLKHNPKLRSVLYIISEAMIKSNSQYKVIYDKRKEYTKTTHPEWHNLVPCPINNVKNHIVMGKKVDDSPKIDKDGNLVWKNLHPKHAHIDAMRAMIKRFLCELYVAW